MGDAGTRLSFVPGKKSFISPTAGLVGGVFEARSVKLRIGCERDATRRGARLAGIFPWNFSRVDNLPETAPRITVYKLTSTPARRARSDTLFLPVAPAGKTSRDATRLRRKIEPPRYSFVNTSASLFPFYFPAWPTVGQT